MRGVTPVDETQLTRQDLDAHDIVSMASSWSPAEVAKENKSKKWLRIDDLNLLFFVNMARWILPPEEWRRVRQLQLLRRCDHSNADSATTTAATFRPSVDLLSTTQYYTRGLTRRTPKDLAHRPPAGHPVSLRVDNLAQLQRTQHNKMDLQLALDRTDPSPPMTRS